MKRFLIIAALLFPLFAASAKDLDRRQIERIVNEARTKWEIPGVAIAIVQDGRITHSAGYGIREEGSDAAVDADTLFGIGSTTKAFTTTALAMLAADGKLSWDDPVRKHLPYFHLNDACADAAVTFRDIVSHRTGMTRHDWLWDNSPWKREEVIRRLGEVSPSKPFRTTYQYQNIMFIAAGEAVAQASGKSWEQFVRERIIEPLGMKRTKLVTRDAYAVANHAVGHHFDSDDSDRVRLFQYFDDENVAPAGAINSSASDMARWLLFQLSEGSIEGRPLISPEALLETRMPHTPIRLEGPSKESNPVTNLQAYALGWIVQDYRGEMLVSHSGALNGYRASVAMLPGSKSGVVILSNLGRSIAVTALRNTMLDALLVRNDRDWNALFLQLESKGIEKDRKQKAETEAKRKSGTKPSRELSFYAGTYHAPGYGEASIDFTDQSLTLRWSRLVVPLEHWHYDTFVAESKHDDLDEMVVFRLDANGEIKAFVLFDAEFEKKGTKP